MMKKMNYYKILVLLLLVTTITSCSDFTDGINDDPNNFTSAPGNLLIGQANLAVVKLSSSQAARVCGIWTDQFTGSDRQYIALNDYLTTAGDFDDDWDDIYADGLAQAKLAEQSGEENGDQILQGVAQIIQGLMLGELASLWGDVPWTQALDLVNFPDPEYDSQVSVLAAAQTLFNDGISNVGDATVGVAYGAPVFIANDAKWAEVAHSLKARYFLVAKDYENAYLESQMGISSINGDLLSAHTDATGAKNMFYQFVAEQRGGYLTANDSFLLRLVNGTTPRLLATPGDVNRKYFVGSELNTGDDGYFAIDASFPIVSFFETKLIEAEAAFRTSRDALTPFNEVRLVLAATYNGSFPSSNSSGQTLLKEILEEKYITLIGSSQVFHDVRRTNNLLGVPVKGTNATTIPQRFLYPQIEVNSNANFPGIVDLFTPTPVNQ